MLRITGALAALALAAVIGGCGGSSNSSSASKTLTATITVTGGKPGGGVKVLTVKKGGKVNLTITSDTADEVHIHGYDLHKDVEKGGTVTFAFPAKIDGQFEIELEDAKQQLASLRVEP